MPEPGENQAPIKDLLKMGQLGLELGYWAQAEAYYDQVLTCAPDHLDALLGKAQACRNVDEALALVQRVLAQQPDNPKALALRQRLVTVRSLPPAISGNATLPQEEDLAASHSASPPRSSRHSRRRSQAQQTLRYRNVAILAAGGITTVLLLTFLLFPHAWPFSSGTPGSTPLHSPLDLLPLAATVVNATAQPIVTPTLANAKDPLEQALAATVLVIVPDPISGEVSRGSGCVLSRDGLVLTNYHVIAEDGVLLNVDGLAFIGFSRDVRRPPNEWYIGTAIATDPVADLAVLRIITNHRGEPLEQVQVPQMPLGESRELRLGQSLIGLGYPALGGNTLTLTRGSMAGFAVGDGDIELGKTDSELLPGSSGGAVLDEAGRLVGIITAAHTDYRTQGRLSYFVLLHQAQPVLERAKAIPPSDLNVTWMLDILDKITQ